MCKDKNIVWLTGPMCSGKGTVSEIFVSLARQNNKAIEAIELDRLGHAVLLHPNVKDRLVLVFGKDVLSEDGSIERSRLAEKAFSCTELTQALNSITHEAIGNELELRLEHVHKSNDFVLIESPLPVRTQQMFVHLGGVIVTVNADVDERLQRALAQGYTRSDALARFAAQPSSDYYSAEANYVVENQNLDDTLNDVRHIFEQLVLKGASDA